MRSEGDVPDRFRKCFCRRWQAEAAVADGQLDDARDAAGPDVCGAVGWVPPVACWSSAVLPDERPAQVDDGLRADPLRPEAEGGAWVVNLTRRVRFWCPEWLASGYVGASRLIFPDEEFALIGGDGVERQVAVHPLALSRMDSPSWREEEASERGISSEVRLDFTGDGGGDWCPDGGEGELFLDSP